MAALGTALFTHGKIKTTLAKAKALRPFAEKLITHAKKGHLADDRAKWLHHFRHILSALRDEYATKMLMEERVTEFLQRNGGYTRIYKLMPRKGDGAPMAIIELIAADDAGYPKRKKKPAKAAQAKAEAGAPAATAEAEDDAAEPETEAEAVAVATDEAETEAPAADEAPVEEASTDEDTKA